MQLKKGSRSDTLEESNSNLTGEIAALKTQLKEQTEALEDMENLSRTLILKETMSNQELQDARKEAIHVYQCYFFFCSIHIS